MVPPILSISFCSSNRHITGSGVLASNSVLFAFSKLHTFRANSIAAQCIPKHNPRYGILFSLAYFIASTFPSIPLSPNPPGINIPLHP